MVRSAARVSLALVVAGLLGCPQAPAGRPATPTPSPSAAAGASAVPLGRDPEQPIVITEQELAVDGHLPPMDFAKWAPTEPVNRGRDWLLRHQLADGSWAADGSVGPGCRDGKCATTLSPELAEDAEGRSVLTTALALVALRTKDSDPIRKGLVWLERQQAPNGKIGVELLDHAFATLALVTHCDAYEVEESAGLGLAYLLRFPKAPADGETPAVWKLIEVIRLEALKRARTSRFRVTDDQLEGGRARLLDLGSRPAEAQGWAQITVLGGQLRAGLEPAQEALLDALNHTAQVAERGALPTVDSEEWFYGTLVADRLDGDAWTRWARSLEGRLLTSQRGEGCAKGSWDPRQAQGPSGSRVSSTAWGVLIVDAYDDHRRRK